MEEWGQGRKWRRMRAVVGGKQGRNGGERGGWEAGGGGSGRK